MINLHTNVEIYVFTHYEDTKGNAKCLNLGSLGWLGITQSNIL